MSTTITTLAFQLRTASQATAKPITLRRAQELIAAALGYPTLAAYQASPEAKIPFEDIRHLAPDWAQVESRCNDLNVSPMRTAIRLLSCLKECLPRATVHRYEWGISSSLHEYLDDEVVNNGWVSSEMAMTNGDGIDEVYLEYGDFEFSALPAPGEMHVETVHGHVSMGIDQERPYYGHKIDVKVQLSFMRTGLRSIGDPDVEVEEAHLNWPGDDDVDVQEPYVAREVVLSEYLDISVEEAELLVDAELDEISSEDGTVYQYILDVSEVEIPGELSTRLMTRFGSLQIGVPTDIYSRIRPEF